MGTAGVHSLAGGCFYTDVAVVAADRERTLVIVVVTANDQVDLVLVEQWQPRFPDTEVRAVSR